MTKFFSAASAKSRPLRSHQAGFGLMEILLTLGAISVMSLGVYAVFFASDVTAEVKNEQSNLNALSTSIDRSFGLTGGFGGVSLDRVLADGLLPKAYTRSGQAITEWGSGISIRPNQVARPNDSFVIDYANVPTNACVRLAAAMASNVYDLRVGGSTVVSSTGLDPAAAATRCGSAGGARMEFVYYSGLSTGAAVATPSLTLPTAPPSVDPANPSTPTGPVVTAPGVNDAVVLPPGTVNPGTPVGPPPVAPPAPPAPSTPIAPPTSPVGPPPVSPPGLTGCTVPGPTTGTQQVGCPAGQYGLINQQRTGVYSCPEAWAAPVLTWGGWGNVSGSCAGCPGAGQEASTQWVAVNGGCPAGQTGSNTWEKEQRTVRNYSYNCPAGTTTLPAPSFGGWGAWADTGAVRNQVNTCRSSVGWRWESVDVAYGPGSGCNLGADQDRADQDAAAGVLIKSGTRPYASYVVNEANYPCNEGALGTVITVYGGCGGWQAGIEGWSGYQCRPTGAYYVWGNGGNETYGAEVYRGTNPSSSPYFAQAVGAYQPPTASCTSANIGQTVTSNTYSVGWWGVGAARYATIRVMTLSFVCEEWRPDF